MVDPNLNFDWDQWDAVFGQHLPVADELMELDPVVGLEFPDFAASAADPNVMNTGMADINGNAMPGAPPAGADGGIMRASPSDWPGYC